MKSVIQWHYQPLYLNPTEQLVVCGKMGDLKALICSSDIYSNYVMQSFHFAHLVLAASRYTVHIYLAALATLFTDKYMIFISECGYVLGINSIVRRYLRKIVGEGKESILGCSNMDKRHWI